MPSSGCSFGTADRKGGCLIAFPSSRIRQACSAEPVDPATEETIALHYYAGNGLPVGRVSAAHPGRVATELPCSLVRPLALPGLLAAFHYSTATAY